MSYVYLVYTILYNMIKLNINIQYENNISILVKYKHNIIFHIKINIFLINIKNNILLIL